MTRDKGAEWSSKSFEETHKKVKESGKSATHEAEQKSQRGEGLDKLVDPKTHGGYRESFSLLVPENSQFVLKYGVALPIKNDFDTTASMGKNIDIALGVLPKVQRLLSLAPNAILKESKYHAQFATGAIQDVEDQHPYQNTEFEPDNEIEKQMMLLVPERNGYDPTEDYQISLFSAAFRTKTSISGYGLKGYYFATGDQIGRDFMTRKDEMRIFGGKCLLQGEISAEELGQELLKNWHGFFLQVKNHDFTKNYWSKILGEERVVSLPETEDTAEIQSIIVGLTEGSLDLQNSVDFLEEVAGLEKTKARAIVRAVSHIPLCAQAILPNFKKLPEAGSIFASRSDLWPIDNKIEGKPEKKKVNWQL